MMKLNAALFSFMPWIIMGLVYLIDGKDDLTRAGFILLIFYPPYVLFALLVAFREGQFDIRDKIKRNIHQRKNGYY